MEDRKHRARHRIERHGVAVRIRVEVDTDLPLFSADARLGVAKGPRVVIGLRMARDELLAAALEAAAQTRVGGARARVALLLRRRRRLLPPPLLRLLRLREIVHEIVHEIVREIVREIGLLQRRERADEAREQHAAECGRRLQQRRGQPAALVQVLTAALVECFVGLGLVAGREHLDVGVILEHGRVGAPVVQHALEQVHAHDAEDEEDEASEPRHVAHRGHGL